MPGERDLPAATERYRQLLTTAEVDWSDEGSVIEYLVDYSRALAGGECPFDERLAALVDTLVLEELANRNAPMPP